MHVKRHPVERQGGCAEIAAVEAYQSGIIRAFLFQANIGNSNIWPYQPTIADVVQSISNLRAGAAGNVNDDQGIVNGAVLTLVPVDAQSLVFARTTSQVCITMGIASTPRHSLTLTLKC